LPPGRLKVLARYAASARAQAIARMPDQRRIATLVAFANQLTATAQDDALDVLDMLVENLLDRVEHDGERARLRTLRDLDAAALRLRDACLILLDETRPDAELRAGVFAHISREQLAAATERVGELARPADDTGYYEELLGRYSQVRRFMPDLLRTIEFQATTAGQPVLDAVRFLREAEGDMAMARMRQAPLGVVNRPWRPFVLGSKRSIDRRYYTFCTLERLQDALRRRDVFVSPSER
jgi:hypothetical protein